MITSDIQYTAAQQQLVMLTESLDAPKKQGVPDVIEQAGKAQTRSLIAQIQTDMREYDRLKNTSPPEIKIESLEDLMTAPIRYRLAANMSLDSFGRKVCVSARQIARYEQENYRNTNSSTLQKILQALDIQLEGTVACE